MTLNPQIILAGQQADILGAIRGGNALAQDTRQMRQQNALTGFLRDNGAALMRGDANALAGYAQFDPQAAMAMQQRQQDRAWQVEDRDYQRQRQQAQDARADQEWQLRVEQYAAQKSTAEREAEAAQIEDAVKMGLALPDAESWDAMMAQHAPELVGQFDNRQAHAQRYMSMAEILRGQQTGASSGPRYGLTPIYGTDAEGNTVVMQIGEDGSAVQTALPEGVKPDLRVKAFETAAGQAAGKGQGQAIADLPGSLEKVERAVKNITAIRDDPALAGITGMIQGRLPPMTQAGTDLNARVQQAQGQMFLEAYSTLRGGGAITENEGLKAERAMARLDRAQSYEAYQQALNEVIEVLETGLKRLHEKAGVQMPSEGQPGGGVPDALSDDDLLKMYGG